MSDRVREYLEAGKRLEDAATPGPWEQWIEHDSIHAYVAENTRHHVVHGDNDGRTMTIRVQAEDYDVPESGSYDADDETAEQYAQNDRSFIADARERMGRYRRAIEAAVRFAETEITKRDAVGVHDCTPEAVLDIMERALLGEDKAGA